MKKNHIGTIKEIKEVNKNVYLIKIFAPTLENIAPGEYISILCEGLTLRRPFSVADFENNTVTILMKKRGEGTRYLSELNIGDKVEFSAPLGNTFKIENKKTLLIGAGIGIAPLIYLNKKLTEAGAQTYFAAGFLSKSDVINVGVETPTYCGQFSHQSPRPLREREEFQYELRVLEIRVRGNSFTLGNSYF